MIAAFEQFLGGAQGRAPFASLGLAVSGGGDSMAMLQLAHDWLEGIRGQGLWPGVTLHAVTVNHGLRDEAADEAAMVAARCAALGLSHDTLAWHWDRTGNLQDAARAGRYALITDWAQAKGIAAVALGHTLDDQAETFLMRLARGSGVDGLAAMRADWQDGLRWLRPLLTVPRAELRAFLRARGLDWAEDPSNEDPRFDRVRARQVLGQLEGLGLDAQRLADTAAHMRAAREALELQTQTAARQACTVQDGDVVIDLDALTAQPFDIQTRLLAHALMWVSSAEYRPRLSALHEVLAQVMLGDRRTLHGCLLEGDMDQVRISREYNAVRRKTARPGEPWDRRWRLTGPDPKAEVRTLGDAIADCPDWRATGRALRSLKASPAVWRDGKLIAAPLAGWPNGWEISLLHPDGHFFTSILSH